MKSYTDFWDCENHSKWLKTNRTHEECEDCQLKYDMPPKCSGHVSGPNHCYSFIRKIKEN